MQIAFVLLVFAAQASGSEDSAPDSPQLNPPILLDVSSDDSRVAVARKDGVVELWDPVELKPLEVLEPAFGSTPWAIALSPNGSRLAVLGNDGRLATWELEGADVEPPEADETPSAETWPRVFAAREKIHGWPFGAALRWTPDGERIVVAESDGNAALCDSAGKVEARWEISPMFGTPPLAFTTYGSDVLTAKGDRVEMRSSLTGRGEGDDGEVRSLLTGSDVIALAVHPTRSLLVTGHPRNNAVVWNWSTGEVVREHTVPNPLFPSTPQEVAATAFSPNGRVLAFTVREGSFVYLFDVDTGEPLWTSEFLGAHFSEPLEIVWSPDSSRVWYAFACGGGELGSHSLSADARPNPFQGRAAVPRFGGDLGLTISWTEDGAQVTRVHPRR